MDIRPNFAAQSLVDEEIRAEIRRHEDTMKALKIRRNTYCAVNQLPNEVLASIFTMVQLLAIAPYPPNRLISQRWTPMLYVCQMWHEIIMDNPRFWSFINLNSNQAPRMLRLSKEVPLQVSAFCPDGSDERFWSLVGDMISQASRLQALAMESFNPDAMTRVLSLIPPASSAPQLQRLNIYVSSGPGELQGNIWLDLPSLLELSILRGPLPSNSHSMPRLTHLKISFQSRGHETTALWLLNTFRSSPNLQDVFIQGLHGPVIDPISPRVSLAYLHTLSITSDDPSTLSIFAHLDAPALTTLCATYYDAAEANLFTGRELAGLETIISQVMNPQITIDSSGISLRSDASLSINGNLHGVDHSEHHSVKFSLPRDLPADILRKVCDLPPLHNATCLYLGSNDGDDLGPQPFSFIPSYTDIERIVFLEFNTQLLQTLLKRNPEQYPPSLCVLASYAQIFAPPKEKTTQISIF